MEVKEPIPEEEEEEEQAWKRQRTDKSGNRNRSAGSKGEGKHNSWENEAFGGCKGGCMTTEEHTEARSFIEFPSLCSRKAVRNNMFTRT